MTVTVTQNVTDIAGITDNTVFRFSAPEARLSDDGVTLISTKPVRAKPVDGLLTVELEPGPVNVSWAGNDPTLITIPDDDSDLWSLLNL